MAAQKGRSLVLKMGDGATPTEAFTTIAAATTNAITINNETVDVSNKTDGQFRQLLPQAGITSLSTTISGIYTATTQQNNLRNVALDASANNYQIVIPDGSSNVTYEGSFIVTSFTETGENNGAVTFEATLESAGDIATS